MIRLPTLSALALLGAACLIATACDSGSSKPAPVAPQATTPRKPGVPALTATQLAAISTTFAEGRVWAEQADALQRKGIEAERADGIQAAIPFYQEARPLYRRASQHVEEWVEPDLGRITQEQVDAFLGTELRELSRWQKANMSMGKFPPKE